MTTAIAKTFYDSLGRSVETLTPGPDASHTTVTFTVYYDQTHSVFTSLPFVVNSRTTWLDPNGAVDDTGQAPGGTATSLDPLGRTISTTDTLHYQSTTTYGLGSVTGDNNTYATTTDVDANKHVQISYIDALGRTRYIQNYKGLSGGTLTATRKQTIQYNALDKPTSVVVTDLTLNTSVTTTATYDDLGRMNSLADPDRGTHTYSFDADGRLYQDISGTRTVGTSYDLLGRVGCIQDAAPTTNGSGTCSSGSHPLVQNTYDTSTLGTAGSTDFPVGRLTQSVATTYYSPTDYTNKTTATEQFQHNQRGQLVASTLQLSVPSGWGFTLPTYKLTQAYNDADQATMTQTMVGGSTGYTFSQAYDSTTGQLTGLSNNSTGVANLATLGFNAAGLVNDVNFQTTTGTALANDHFGFDNDLRPQSSVATWQSGSGATGTIFSTNRTYDPVGNVISLSTTQAAVPGQTGSGGSETQNFCYDGRNRLVWAGNSGTQPGPGNGTCGTATLSSGLNGASYNSSFTYTQLGLLSQAPLNGSGAAQQYLYCNSGHPHQLTGVYPTGTTCSNPTGATYSASYDSWGNITSRTYAGVTATLTYDVLDQLVKWDAGTGNKEWYAYDASGNRVLLRSITTSGTNNTTYPFGLEEHTYNATGSNIGNTYYYTLGGRLIGALSGTTTLNTQFFLTDALGSVLATFSATAGSAAVLGNQVYGPYGNQRYNAGSMGTTKGFTGQYADPSGLDYYKARYYDPVVGVFLSADTVQGNLQGMNPYGYVNGDPETYNDPKGQYYADMNGDTYHQGAPFYQNSQGTAYNIYTGQLYNGNGYKNGWLPTQGTNARPSHSTSKGQRVPTHVHVVPVPAGVLAPALVKLAQKLIRNNTRLGGDFGSNQWTVLSVEDGGTIINDNSGGVYTHRWYFTMDDGNGSKVVLSLNLNSAPGAKDPWDMQHIHFSSDEYQPDPGKWGTQGYERNIDWFDPGASEDPGEESAMSAFAQAMLEAESDIESSIIDEDLAE